MASACGGVQAQDRLGEQLGLAARSTGFTATAVDQARTIDRTVVRTWLMRGTLHLVPSADLHWMLDLLGPAMDAKALKRRASLDITADDHGRVLAFLREELTNRGPLTRREIGAALCSAGLPWQGAATPHLLRTASLHGVMCFGPARDGESTLVSLDDWLPSSGPRPPDPAAELARRYFSAFGPATSADFRWWSGLPAAQARSAIEKISGELATVSVEYKNMSMMAGAAERIEEVLTGPRGVLRVLGPFDPYLLGYAKRDLGVAEGLLKRVNAGGAMIRSCVMVDGRLVGTWDRKRRTRGLTVTVKTFEPLSGGERAQVDRQFLEFARFLDSDIKWREQPD